MSAYAPTLSGIIREPEAPNANHVLTRDEVMTAREVAETAQDAGLDDLPARSARRAAREPARPHVAFPAAAARRPARSLSWVRPLRQVPRRIPRAARGPRAR